MDRSLFLDVNRLTRQSAWAHGVMRFLAHDAGVAIIALLVLASFLRVRSPWRNASLERVASVLWIPVGVAIAAAAGELVAHVVARTPPALAVHSAAVLVAVSAHHGSLPSESVVIAGAAAAGLWLAGERVIAMLATAVALLLAFDEVYVGSHYPGDVAAGLALGTIVTVAGYAISEPWLAKLVERAARGPLAPIVGVDLARPLVTAGPASAPTQLRATGSVRILGRDELAYGRGASPDVTGS
jgi:undecaprenyl-diphosphatase